MGSFPLFFGWLSCSLWFWVELLILGALGWKKISRILVIACVELLVLKSCGYKNDLETLDGLSD